MKLKNNPIFLVLLISMILLGVSYAAADTSGANAPDLYNGVLYPVTFDGDGNTIILTDLTLTTKPSNQRTADNVTEWYVWKDGSGNRVDWYNYDEKQWANAVTLDATGRANPELATAANITGYYVWIPRYAYSVNSGYHTSTVGTKKILFLQETSNKDIEGVFHSTLYESVDYIGDRQINYLVHPAFSFGGNVSGFWMAKFESSKSSSSTVRVLPNQTAWKSISIGDAFDKILAMKDSGDYGLTGSRAEPHLIKNVEWGAMAYLTASRYGKESEEVWINNYSKTTTGMGSKVSASATGTSKLDQVVDYKTAVNGKIQQSTTGNIYGIYDTSGGLWEYVAGYINTRDQYNNAIDPNTENVINKNGESLFNSNYKYKDLYKRGESNQGDENYNLASSKKGDGVWETSSTWYSTNSFSWFGDYSYMPNTYYPFFARGGNYTYGAKAGIFSFMCTAGGANAMSGFRVAISGLPQI